MQLSVVLRLATVLVAVVAVALNVTVAVDNHWVTLGSNVVIGPWAACYTWTKTCNQTALVCKGMEQVCVKMMEACNKSTSGEICTTIPLQTLDWILPARILAVLSAIAGLISLVIISILTCFNKKREKKMKNAFLGLIIFGCTCMLANVLIIAVCAHRDAHKLKFIAHSEKAAGLGPVGIMLFCTIGVYMLAVILYVGWLRHHEPSCNQPLVNGEVYQL